MDVCKALGLKNPSQALKDHVDSEDLRKSETVMERGKQTVNFVNECGLYALLLGLKNTSQALKTNVDPSDLHLMETRSGGQVRKVNFVNPERIRRKARETAENPRDDRGESSR